MCMTKSCQQTLPTLTIQMSVLNHHRPAAMVLVLSSGSAAGIDLKCTNSIYLLEPDWGTLNTRQAVGRGARLHSHEALPPQWRYVTVHRMLLTRPDPEADKPLADEEVYAAVRRKEQDVEAFYRTLRAARSSRWAAAASCKTAGVGVVQLDERRIGMAIGGAGGAYVAAATLGGGRSRCSDRVATNAVSHAAAP